MTLFTIYEIVLRCNWFYIFSPMMSKPAFMHSVANVNTVNVNTEACESVKQYEIGRCVAHGLFYRVHMTNICTQILAASLHTVYIIQHLKPFN